jgi:hypothetical protein
VHLPGVAGEIQNSGFSLDETQEYAENRFRSVGNKSKSAVKKGGSGKPK